jgi:hypothetical protein
VVDGAAGSARSPGYDTKHVGKEPLDLADRPVGEADDRAGDSQQAEENQHQAHPSTGAAPDERREGSSQDTRAAHQWFEHAIGENPRERDPNGSADLPDQNPRREDASLQVKRDLRLPDRVACYITSDHTLSRTSQSMFSSLSTTTIC